MAVRIVTDAQGDVAKIWQGCMWTGDDVDYYLCRYKVARDIVDVYEAAMERVAQACGGVR